MDILYLTKTDKEGNRFLIGELTKDNNEYIFKYTSERADKPEGFIKVPTFKDIGKVYKSDNLFLFFANRLFDKSRPDLPQLLKKYGLDDYDEWELLKATRAKMMTDGYELTPMGAIAIG